MRKNPLFAVYFVIFLDMLGFGIMIPAVRDLTQLLVRNSELAWPGPEVYMGILMAAYSGAQMISASFLGRLSDIYGRKPIFLLSAVGNVASYGIWIASTHYWPFLIGRILSGITGGNIAIAQSIIADQTNSSERPRAMGLLGACIGMGFVLGPFFGGLLINFNQNSSLYMIEINQYWPIGAACFLLGVLAVILIIITPFLRPAESKDREGYGRSFTRAILAIFGKSSRGMFSAHLLSQISFVSFEVLFAWILQRQYQFDLKETYYFFGFQGVLLAVIQGGVYRRFEKRRPPEYWFRAGLIISFLGMCALPWIGYLQPVAIFGVSLKISLLVILLTIMSIGLGFGSPSINAYASMNAPKNEQGQTMGSMQAIGAFARFSAPLMATSLYAVALPIPFLLGGLFCLTAWWIFRRAT